MMGNKPQEEKRPRGRPRKNLICAETNKRSRGRPRKNSNFNCAQLRDLEKKQKKEIENDNEKEKQVAEKKNEQVKEEAEKENLEDKEEAEKENVEEKETEEAEKEKDNEGSSESVRDGVRVSSFDSPAEAKNRPRGRPRKNLHCAEMGKRPPGRPRKNLNCAKLRDLEKQKEIENDNEREEDMEEKEDEEEREIGKENVEEGIEKENEQAKEKVKEGSTEFAGETKGDGVWVSIFEYSAESYFHDIDRIASVCGTDDEESFEPHVIHRFSTAVTFLRSVSISPQSLSF